MSACLALLVKLLSLLHVRTNANRTGGLMHRSRQARLPSLWTGLNEHQLVSSEDCCQKMKSPDPMCPMARAQLYNEITFFVESRHITLLQLNIFNSSWHTTLPQTSMFPLIRDIPECIKPSLAHNLNTEKCLSFGRYGGLDKCAQ